MILQLTENRRIGSNASGFNLQRKKVVKGETQWEQYRWYPNLKLTLLRAPEQLLKESDANGVAEILALLRKQENMIMNAFGIGEEA